MSLISHKFSIAPRHFVLLFTGNALGYIRMVRSGGLSHCSRAIKFVPDLDDIPSFETLATESGLSDETVSASKYVQPGLQYEYGTSSSLSALSVANEGRGET